MRARQPYRHSAGRIWALAASGLPTLRVHGVLFAGFCSMRFRRGLVGRHSLRGSCTVLARSFSEPAGRAEVRSGRMRFFRRIGGRALASEKLRANTVQLQQPEAPALGSGRWGVLRAHEVFVVGFPIHAAPAGAGWTTLFAGEFHGVGAEFLGACWAGGGALRLRGVFFAENESATRGQEPRIGEGRHERSGRLHHPNDLPKCRVRANRRVVPRAIAAGSAAGFKPVPKRRFPWGRSATIGRW